MPLYEYNPLEDTRWDGFVESHPRGQAFHTSGWLRALQKTYGYRPLALSTSHPEAPLQNAIPFCEVSSWLTGKRLVSLPFSDHCDPLFGTDEEASELLRHLSARMAEGRYRYLELRTMGEAEHIGAMPFKKTEEQCLIHTISLEPALETLMKNMHKNCIQRKVQRAEREGIAYEAGRSETLLEQFYRMMVLTRRRHSIPPQPFAWFRNLSECMGERLRVHVAYKSAQPIAAMITLWFKQTVIYKYGCSDESMANLGATPFLFWKVIEEGKAAGAAQIDLGRTDLDGESLATFKERLGGSREMLHYYRFSEEAPEGNRKWSRIAPLFRPAVQWIPDPVFKAIGSLLYRHVG